MPTASLMTQAPFSASANACSVSHVAGTTGTGARASAQILGAGRSPSKKARPRGRTPPARRPVITDHGREGDFPRCEGRDQLDDHDAASKLR
jgi:hypothetical protein